ncbi:MAG: DnaD domain protein [Clostridia bacterium]|nr:DnaD domain protein [Clostridia bacterium]
MPTTAILKDSALCTSTIIDNRFIENYMPEAPEHAVKVYLFGLMLLSRSGGDADDIASALSLTQEDVDEAYFYWEKTGLVHIDRGENGNIAVRYLSIPSPANVIPSAANEKRYASLVEKLRVVLGTRNLSGAELRRIYDWIEVYHFDEDAAAEIVAHCIAIKGARVHINYMDSVAKRLAADSILSHGDVIRSFENEKLISGGAASILKRWHISRRPTDDEIALYEKWTKGWGFTDEALDIALGEMVAVDRPNFKFLDAVLSGYHERGSITSEGIKEAMREQDMIRELARQAFVRAGMKRNANMNDRRQFEFWLKEYGMNAELIMYAAELSSTKGTPFAEMKKLIEDWHKRGIASYAAAKEDAEHRENEKESAGKSVNPALRYKQRKYTKEDLKRIGVDFGEDDDED